MAEYTYDSEFITGATGIEPFVKSMFGWPVVNVELSANHYTYAFNNSIEEYSSYVTNWAIKSHIANALGLPSNQDFTSRWVSQNFEFSKSFAKAYSEQANVGGEVPIRRDYITLIPGKQIYYLEDDIQVTEVMWQEPPAISRYLIDPNNNPAWVNYEFGWGYMGSSFQYVVPSYFNIQLAQATELRYRILRGDFSYTIRPAEADASRTGLDYTGKTRNAVYIYPVPDESRNGTRIWYFYKNLDDLNQYANQEKDSLVSNPGTIQSDEIPYSAFNSAAQRWIRQYSLSTCKEILGRIRSKFSTLPIPDAEITLDGDQLISEAQEEKRELKEYLLTELESMDIGTLIEGDANNAENINRSLAYNPMGIHVG